MPFVLLINAQRECKGVLSAGGTRLAPTEAERRPLDHRTGARCFLAIEVDSSKAEKYLLDNEEESRAYFDQLWAEAMVIFNSCKDKGSLLKLPKEMEEQIIEYRKQFMQEDTMAGQVQGWLWNRHYFLS